MDLDEAIWVHQVWKVRLRHHLEGSEHVDALTVERDDACPLGHWLRGEGTRYAQLPQFRDLLVEHAEFHRHAARIVRLFNSGAASDAATLLDHGDYHASSTRLMELLHGLQSAMARTEPPQGAPT